MGEHKSSKDCKKQQMYREEMSRMAGKKVETVFKNPLLENKLIIHLESVKYITLIFYNPITAVLYRDPLV